MQPSRSIKSHTRHTCIPLPMHTSTVPPSHPPSTSHFSNSLSLSLSINTHTHTRHMAEESRLPSGSSGRLCLGVGGGDSANTTPTLTPSTHINHTHNPCNGAPPSPSPSNCSKCESSSHTICTYTYANLQEGIIKTAIITRTHTQERYFCWLWYQCSQCKSFGGGFLRNGASTRRLEEKTT